MPFADAGFQQVVVDSAGVAPRIEMLLPISVRHRQMTVRTLLLGMLLVLADRRPAYLTEVRAALTSLPEADQIRPQPGGVQGGQPAAAGQAGDQRAGDVAAARFPAAADQPAPGECR